MTRNRKAEVDYSDRRAFPRIALMLRAAKLICEQGEYVCIVRDVSLTGTKLRVFHPLPAGKYFLLELANGDRYPIETVWQSEDHAGFRFAEPIDLARFMEEPAEHARRPIRLRIHQPVLVTANGADHAAMLVNISQQGACIDAGTELAVGQQLRLEIANLPLRFGYVRWRQNCTHGLVFQQAFRLDEFALHALAMQSHDDASDDCHLIAG